MDDPSRSSKALPLLIAIIILMILSALFSATETAFNSMNTIKLKNIASGDDKKRAKKAKRTLEISEKYESLLSTILVGNNLVNILMASLATVFCSIYFKEDIAVTVSTAATTILVLIFGEISPKILAKNSSESFAMFISPAARVLMFILTPINFLFGLWIKVLGKLFKSKNEEAITEDDLITIVEEAEEGGHIDEDESQIIRSAITFNEQDVFSILTPRVDIVYVDETDTNEQIFETFRTHGFSRLPVCRGGLDDIIGIINEKDFCEKVLYGNSSLESILTEPKFVSLFTKISDLMNILKAEKCHMAVAVDEYGGTAGIVTLEDILEELVGEIWDEHDKVEEDFTQLSENKTQVRATVSCDDLFEYFSLDDESESATAGGWVMEKLEAIPAEGDKFSFGVYDITVLKVEDNRVVSILFEKTGRENDEDDE